MLRYSNNRKCDHRRSTLCGKAVLSEHTNQITPPPSARAGSASRTGDCRFATQLSAPHCRRLYTRAPDLSHLACRLRQSSRTQSHRVMPERVFELVWGELGTLVKRSFPSLQKKQPPNPIGTGLSRFVSEYKVCERPVPNQYMCRDLTPVNQYM